MFIKRSVLLSYNESIVRKGLSMSIRRIRSRSLWAAALLIVLMGVLAVGTTAAYASTSVTPVKGMVYQDTYGIIKGEYAAMVKSTDQVDIVKKDGTVTLKLKKESSDSYYTSGAVASYNYDTQKYTKYYGLIQSNEVSSSSNGSTHKIFNLEGKQLLKVTSSRSFLYTGSNDHFISVKDSDSTGNNVTVEIYGKNSSGVYKSSQPSITASCSGDASYYSHMVNHGTSFDIVFLQIIEKTNDEGENYYSCTYVTQNYAYSNGLFKLNSTTYGESWKQYEYSYYDEDYEISSYSDPTDYTNTYKLASDVGTYKEKKLSSILTKTVNYSNGNYSITYDDATNAFYGDSSKLNAWDENTNTSLVDTIDPSSSAYKLTINGYSLALPSPYSRITEQLRVQHAAKGIYYAKNSSGKYGIIDSNGNKLVNFNYDGFYDANYSPTNYVVAKKGTKFYFLTLPTVAEGTAKLAKSAYTYTGKTIKPSVKVTYNGNTLKKGTDYTVSYSNNKAVGTATITINGKGNYVGSKKVTFKINPKGTKSISLTKSGSGFKVKWSKVSGVTGYQVKYTTASKSKTVKVKGANTKSKVIKKLKKGKTYKVQVRSYKTVKGKTYYSSWSKAKKMKYKK